MKSVAVMHTQAVLAVAGSGRTPTREVILVAAADEEDGGAEGASWLVTEHPEAVGFSDKRPVPEVVGEGAYGLSGIVDAPLLRVAVGEKTALWVSLHAAGPAGHGSLPQADQAPLNVARAVARLAGRNRPRLDRVIREQLRSLATATSGWRAVKLRALSSFAGPVFARGLVGRLRPTGVLGALLADTVAATMLEAGFRQNVVPGEATAALDCRLMPDTDPDRFLESMRVVAGRFNVSVSARAAFRSPVSDRGALYSVLESASRRVVPGCIFVPTLCHGVTDVRFFRAAGAAGYGWVPVVLPPELMSTFHGDDERIPLADFDRGVEAMTEVVMRTAT